MGVYNFQSYLFPDEEREGRGVMSSQPDPPSEILPLGILSGEPELEWLLCLASTFQACQRQQLAQVEETSQL